MYKTNIDKAILSTYVVSWYEWSLVDISLKMNFYDFDKELGRGTFGYVSNYFLRAPKSICESDRCIVFVVTFA